jgi:hypothetical protein
MTEREKPSIRLVSSQMPSGLASGGDGPHDPDMEARVRKLERFTEDIRSILGRLEPAISKIRDDTNEIKGKLSQMPTVWQLLSLIIAIFGFAFVLVKFAIPSH